MWTVVYVAQSKAEVDKIEKALTDHGVLVKIRQIGKCKSGQALFEVLVPHTEVDDACFALTTISY